MDTSLHTYLDEAAMRHWRHRLHRWPELGFEEDRTGALIEDCLRTWGYTVSPGIAGTGLVGTLVFGDGGRRLGLRAEMDALPIQEATGLPWASQLPGQMHACGHDGHTAILLGAAQALATLQRQGINWHGTLHVIFQPAEELGGKGGARRMMDEGLFERFPCDAVFAMHNLPGLPAGTFHFGDGPFMASSDRVLLTFQGLGGHGALPHLAKDPTIAAAATIMALQSIVARAIDPLAMGVITVGRILAGTAYNIIPQSAELELSVRALDPGVRQQLEDRIRAIAEGQAASFGMTCTIRYESGYPVLINSHAETALARHVARALFGAERVRDNAPPLCASEDFAYMLQHCPGSYVCFGNGDNGHVHGQPIGPCSVHNPAYDFNDANLLPGALFWVALARAFFTSSTKEFP